MIQVQPYYTALELSKITGVGDRAIRKRATNESWSYVVRVDNGTRKKCYLYSLLPKPIQAQIQLFEGQVKADENLPAPVCSGTSPEALEIQATAARRLLAVQAVYGHMNLGATQASAIEVVGKQAGHSESNIYRWLNKVTGLPEQDWMHALAPRPKAQAPAKQVKQKPEDLKGWQRKTMEARLAIIQEWNNRAETMGANQAAQSLIEEAECGVLPEHLQGLISVANARKGKDGKRTLSRTTLFRWKKDVKSGLTALAPKKADPKDLPAWAGLFMECYRKAAKPSVPAALEEMQDEAPPGFPIPTRDQAYRFLKKISVKDRNKGRMSPQQLRSIRGHIIRDDSDLMPTSIYVCDGHSFKARVAHPAHGGAFHPECCAVIDVATRVCVGWSVGLAESAKTVADALRHGVTVNEKKLIGGVPAIFYSDRGAGNMAKVISDDVTGLLARIGTTQKVGIPGNAQARGIVEQLNKPLWIRAAKKLPTCTHKDMDKTVARKVYLQVEKDVRTMGRSDLLPTWKQFLDLCRDTVDRYNNRPHTHLPKVTDPKTGRRRHMTPMEMWGSYLAEGWRPVILEEHELTDLFRPCIMVTTRRAQVTVFGNPYYDPELEHFHGQKVFVHYDWHDPDRVWVRDQDESLICIARFRANEKRWFPKSVEEQCIDQRAARRAKLKENQLAEIEAERRGVIDVAPIVPELTPAQDQAAAKVIELAERKQAQRRYPSDDFEAYEWLTDEIRAGAELTAQEQQWVDDFEHCMETGKKRGLHKAGWAPFAERNKRAAM
ncbi:Mu transposase C-terminal domain-containing protein [Desulfatibacillum aliphaticivorans]|uniref:Mu transposase C-terminal domain-containing protein n=1 Tax=Desulfatibacillum aliphaticivorans TaxID=218208 RepID=UPI000401C614|nr:Mu transposase C-terminal domain-containing protein [Desulfatibacillum aliphaticivorans]